MQDIFPQLPIHGDLLGDGPDHVKRGPVDVEDHQLAPDNVLGVSEYPERGRCIGVDIDICVYVLSKTSSDLQIPWTPSYSEQGDMAGAALCSVPPKPKQKTALPVCEGWPWSGSSAQWRQGRKTQPAHV